MAYTERRTNGWVGRYRVDGRLKSTKLFKTKRDARAEADAQERAGKSSEWIDPSRSTVSLAEYFDEWQSARRDRAPRTLEAEQERFRSLIAPAFGRTPLKRLDHDAIRAWSASMPAPRSGGAPASQARRRDATRLLIAILDSAVDSRRLRSNPARTPSGKVPYLPRQSRSKEHRYLTHEQLRRLSDAAGTLQASALILFTGLTGLRWGEVSALRVSDLYLLRGRVRVARAYSRLDNGSLHLGPTKTHASREVPIGATLRAVLERQMADKAKDELLFAQADGAPLKRESFDRNSYKPAVRVAGNAVTALQQLLGLDDVLINGVYDQNTRDAVVKVQRANSLEDTGVCHRATWGALAAADVANRDGMTQGQKVSRTRDLAALSRLTLGPGATDFGPLTFHDLRHTAASLAIAGGATVKGVQRLLGHESAVLTLNTYAGLFDTDLDALGDLLSAASAAAAHHALTRTPEPAPDIAAMSPTESR